MSAPGPLPFNWERRRLQVRGLADLMIQVLDDAEAENSTVVKIGVEEARLILYWLGFAEGEIINVALRSPP